ncbi:hypothetical protein JCM17843_07260 [Kordiimonadales bacterium JCM 17843]|nr:hypothetical protein JCM17843_07260 [Kordiimonadales bacterium JCM 17843]
MRALLDRYDDRFTVAEIGDHSSLDELISYVNGPDRLHTAYSFVFIENKNLSAKLIRDALEAWQDTEQSAWPSWAFSNHDAPRVASRWGAQSKDGAPAETDPRFAAMLNSLLCCLRGTAFVYQGQELGLPQAHVPFEYLRDPEAIANWPDTLGRDGARTPMPWDASSPQCGFSTARPWLPIDPRHAQLAANTQYNDPNSPFSQMKAFLRARKNHPALIHGTIRFFESPEPILAFERTDGSERLLCAFNLGEKAVDWHPQIAASWTATDLPGCTGTLEDGRIHLPPYGQCILSRK